MFLSCQGVKVLAFLAGPDQRAKQLEAGGTAATSCVGVQGRQNETTMNVQYSVVPRQNETTMTVEYSGIQQPKLKWDLKSLEVAKKTQEFRLTKTIEDSCCVQVEKLKAEAVMFQCARCIDSVLVREKPSATRFRRVSVDGVEWLYR